MAGCFSFLITLTWVDAEAVVNRGPVGEQFALSDG